MTNNTNPTHLYPARSLRCVEYLVCGITECAPPKVRILLAWIQR
jgi:hypothetical protein